MAEEKKFLNEEMEKSNHKLMVKYIALSVVIFVILILCVLAWFSSKQEANASGLTIKATADNGLQVAICEKPNNQDYTAKEEWSSFAYQQTYHSSFTSSEPLPLISGDGLRFFEPYFVKVAENYTDKLDIDVLDNAGEVEWIDVTENTNSQLKKSKYIEYKLKFRNDKKSNVFLTGDSKVTPDSSDAYNPLTYDKNLNQSNFSKNFISATARIAFLNKVTVNNTEKLNVHNLWIPNDDIELNHVPTTQGTEYTYKEIESTVDDFDSTVTVNGGSSGDAAYTGGTPSGYYLWINHSNVVEDKNGNTVTLSTQNNVEKDMKKIVDDNKKPDGGIQLYQVKLDKKDQYNNDVYAYYVNINVPAGFYNSSIPLIFTRNSALIWDTYENNPSQSVARNQVLLFGESEGSTAYNTNIGTITFKTCANNNSGEYGSNYNFRHDDDNTTYSYFETIWFNENNISQGGTIQISFTNVKSGGTDNKRDSAYSKIVSGPNSGTIPKYDVDVNKDKYDIKLGDKLVFSASNNDAGNYAISSSQPNTGVEVASPPAGDTTDFWTVDSKTDEGAFTLKNSSGEYLMKDSSGNLTKGSTGGTQFYAVNKYKINGVEQTLKGIMLFTLEGNYFVNYNGANFVCSSTYDTDYTYHIYKRIEEQKEIPGSWGIRTPLTDPKSENETQFYYRTVNPDNVPNTKKQQLARTESRTEYILSADLTKNAIPTEYQETVDLNKHPNFIVSIDTSDGQGFFVSKEITVRIWGEGYDREAQTPLQGGKMQVDLHFFAVEDE